MVEVVETQADKDFKLLDVRFLDTPGLAVEQSREVARNMAELSKEAFFLSMDLVSVYDEKEHSVLNSWKMKLTVMRILWEVIL